MKKQTLFDEHIMNYLSSVADQNYNPLDQEVSTSSNTIRITHSYLFNYYNFSGRPFDILVNGGYKDGKTKIQSGRD